MDLPGLRTSASTKFGIKGWMPCDSHEAGNSPSKGRIWAGEMVHQVKALAMQTLQLGFNPWNPQ